MTAEKKGCIERPECPPNCPGISTTSEVFTDIAGLSEDGTIVQVCPNPTTVRRPSTLTETVIGPDVLTMHAGYTVKDFDLRLAAYKYGRMLMQEFRHLPAQQ